MFARQARRYISESLGPPYTEGSVLDLDAMLAESDNRTPMVCLLSMGSDPTENIERLARTKVNELEVGGKETWGECTCMEGGAGGGRQDLILEAF